MNIDSDIEKGYSSKGNAYSNIAFWLNFLLHHLANDEQTKISVTKSRSSGTFSRSINSENEVVSSSIYGKNLDDSEIGKRIRLPEPEKQPSILSHILKPTRETVRTSMMLAVMDLTAGFGSGLINPIPPQKPSPSPSNAAPQKWILTFLGLILSISTIQSRIIN